MPKLVYDVVFELDTKSVKTLKDALNAGSGRSKRGLQQAKNDVEELDQSMRGLAVTSDRLDQGLSNVNTSSVPFANRIRGMKGSVDDMSKSVNNSNQILFSFGDAVQDGAQFSQGFAQGARAVGNNLTFAAEQIALANQKTGSIGQTFKLLGSSLLGPAGVVFAVNALVTVITLWATESDKAKKKTKELEKSLSDLGRTAQETSRLADELTARGFFSDEGRNKIVRIRSEIERLENRNESLRTQNERLTVSQEDQARARELLNKRYSETVRLEEDEKQELQALLSIMSTSSRTRQKANEEIENNETRIKQLNKELAELNITQSQADSAFQELNTELFNLGIEVGNVSDDLVTMNKELSASVNRFKDLQRNAQGGLGFTPERLTGEMISQAFAVDPLGDARTIANMKVDLHEDTEKAQTEITRREQANRVALITQGLGAISNVMVAAFDGSKGAKIAAATLDTLGSATAAFYAQQVPGDPTAWGRGIAAASFALASGFARISQMERVTPENPNAGGAAGGGGNPQGFKTSSIEARSTPNSDSLRDRNRQPSIVVEANNILPDTEFSVRAERGRRRRTKKAFVLSSDREGNI